MNYSHWPKPKPAEFQALHRLVSVQKRSEEAEEGPGVFLLSSPEALAMFLPCLAFLLCSAVVEALQKQPNVQVYSRHPVVKGKKNTLHCHVEGFHPPKIEITLQKDGAEIKKVEQSDLSFKPDWTFERLVYTHIVPDGKANYSCIVAHSSMTAPKNITWEQEY